MIGGKVTLKTFVGSWNLNFPGNNFNIDFKPGKVTLNTKSIKVVQSKNKKYPSTQGWLTFTFKTWTYYIRKTKIGISTIRINKKGKIDVRTATGKGLLTLAFYERFRDIFTKYTDVRFNIFSYPRNENYYS